jgi:hypothetical protein
MWRKSGLIGMLDVKWFLAISAVCAEIKSLPRLRVAIFLEGTGTRSAIPISPFK